MVMPKFDGFHFENPFVQIDIVQISLTCLFMCYIHNKCCFFFISTNYSFSYSIHSAFSSSIPFAVRSFRRTLHDHLQQLRQPIVVPGAISLQQQMPTDPRAIPLFFLFSFSCVPRTAPSSWRIHASHSSSPTPHSMPPMRSYVCAIFPFCTPPFSSAAAVRFMPFAVWWFEKR